MQLLASRAGSNGGACFSLAKNGEPRPAVLMKMREPGAFSLVTAGRALICAEGGMQLLASRAGSK